MKFMTLEDTSLLKTGDVVRCNLCPSNGCDNRPARVRIEYPECGCVDYRHARNTLPFAWDAEKCVKQHGKYVPGYFVLCSSDEPEEGIILIGKQL